MQNNQNQLRRKKTAPAKNERDAKRMRTHPASTVNESSDNHVLAIVSVRRSTRTQQSINSADEGWGKNALMLFTKKDNERKKTKIYVEAKQIADLLDMQACCAIFTHRET